LATSQTMKQRQDALHLVRNYFVRIYELRERVVGYLIATTNDVQNA